MGIGFFTTRKILEALGVVDLGIYNVVGSLIMMFDFISSGLSNSTQRYINIGLGKNDLKLTNQYFSHSFFVLSVLKYTWGNLKSKSQPGPAFTVK